MPTQSMSNITSDEFYLNRKLSPTTILDEFLRLENFQRAWEKVAENRGCAGGDGETIDKFARNQTLNIYQLRDAVANITYQPFPCKQVIIPKRSGTQRELKIPTVRDRIVQQALLNVLYPLMEEKFSSASFAYRPNLSYINAVEKIADWRDRGYHWVLDADIVKFFDNIDHHRLLKEVRRHIDNPRILCLIKAWISVGVLTEEGLILPQKGIPQGAVISPLLANIYLHEFDELVMATDLKLVRYADDFLVLARTHEQILLAKSEITNLLNSIGLMMHTEKTQITNFGQGFIFLGHGFLENAIFPVDASDASLISAIEKIDGILQRQNKAKNKRKKKSPDSSHFLSPTKREVLNSIPFLASDGVEKLGAYNDEATRDISTLHQPFLAEVETELAPQSEENESAFQKNIWNRDMAAIYLVEQGTSLYKDYQRFIIHVSEKQKLEVPIREVQQILVFGNIQLSTSAIQTCLQEEIAVLFLSQSGQYHGHLWSAESRHLENELVQVEKRCDAVFQLNVSRAIVYGKLMNSKQLLLRFNRKRKLGEVERAILGITQDIEALELIDNLDTLRGYEGIAAARYFPAFGKLITNDKFKFSLRNRQPPTDPVNSLLSFGYTLLFNNVLSFIIAEGLSPYLGNFHYGERQKHYLAFDLMEEMRSVVVDALVVDIVNHSLFKPHDFDIVSSTGGVYLSQSARKVFLKQFEMRMNEKVSHPDLQSKVTYRHAIQLQVRRYKRSLLSGIAYEAFLRAM
ncbi:CRISPR-associated endonuclease Cas1 [Geitlerinema splendidum]|nr:CRISPR-associated endonuclease Cas1 [Geitlerinema splendidum]